MSIHGKRYAISDGDRAGDPLLNETAVRSGLMRGIQKCHKMSHLVKNVRVRFTWYKYNMSPETGPNQHPVTLHTSIVV
jgi:hypothetical protein